MFIKKERRFRLANKFGFLAVSIFALVSIVGTQEKYELTKVDIFGLGKMPLETQVSVFGISIGDSMESVLKMLNKREDDLISGGSSRYILIIGDDLFRILFSDKKTVWMMMLLPGFEISLKGKTAKFYDLKSLESMKAFVEECFGKPDYVLDEDDESDDFAGWYEMYYLNGFNFVWFNSELHIKIMERDKLGTWAESLGAKKAGDVIKNHLMP
jgi:hypothetical protein